MKSLTWDRGPEPRSGMNRKTPTAAVVKAVRHPAPRLPARIGLRIGGEDRFARVRGQPAGQRFGADCRCWGGCCPSRSRKATTIRAFPPQLSITFISLSGEEQFGAGLNHRSHVFVEASWRHDCNSSPTPALRGECGARSRHLAKRCQNGDQHGKHRDQSLSCSEPQVQRCQDDRSFPQATPQAREHYGGYNGPVRYTARAATAATLLILRCLRRS